MPNTCTERQNFSTDGQSIGFIYAGQKFLTLTLAETLMYVTKRTENIKRGPCNSEVVLTISSGRQTFQ
jgi:hypothetical protein